MPAALPSPGEPCLRDPDDMYAGCGALLGVPKRNNQRAHCTICHATFRTVSAFDAHQNDAEPVVCVDPSTVGLRQRPDGLWVWAYDGPNGEGDAETMREASNAPHRAAPGAYMRS